LVVTDVSDENIAAIFTVTQSTPSYTVAIFVRGLSVLSIDRQTGFGESGASMTTNVLQFLWENWMATFAVMVSTGNSFIYQL
jgi:hypothetical protein